MNARNPLREDTTLTAKITANLRENIISGDIACGAKLSEPKLAEKFQVSRGPIREAIRRLEAMGLVRHIAHEGVRVITLSVNEVIDIYHVREALEGKAAALAARNMSPDEVASLQQLVDIHSEHQCSTGTYYQAEGDFDFHYKIIQGSNNAFLIRQLCEDLYHRVRMFRYQSSRLQHRAHLAIHEHQHIVFAIEQRDEQLAELAMRRHIAKARDDIAKTIGANVA